MSDASSLDGDHSNPTRALFDDVWGDDDDVDENNDDRGTHSAVDTLTSTSYKKLGHTHHHPSDIPRLRQEHTTAGFREGLTLAKARSVQAGFDEGFGLGATLGSRAGRLLGVLEGLVAATASYGRSSSPGQGSSASVASPPARQDEPLEPPGDGEGDFRSGSSSRSPSQARHRLEKLLAEARRELRAESIFSPTYWAADGTWVYEVDGGGGGDTEGHVSGEIVFEDVAAAHPLIRTWEALVGAEADRWAIRWNVLDEDNVARAGGGDAEAGKLSSPGTRRREKRESGGREVQVEEQDAATEMGEGERPVVRKELDW